MQILTQKWEKNALFGQAEVHANALARTVTERQPSHTLSCEFISFATFQKPIWVEYFRIFPNTGIVVQFMDINADQRSLGY